MQIVIILYIFIVAAQKYIRPNVPNIYLANGKGTGKINYAKIVSKAVNQQNGISGYSNESVYLDEEAFNSFIFNSIVSCQKRSKQAYKTYFIKTECLETYYKELLSLYSSLFIGKIKKSDTEEIWEQMNALYLKYAKNKYVESIINPSIVYQTKRTDAKFIDVDVPNVPISDWKAVHDIMDYGDAEETIYRNLFKEGCIRIEIKLPDKYGEIKENGKVYYISDPSPISAIIPSSSIIDNIIKDYSDEDKTNIANHLNNLIYNDCINIKQSAWIEYNNMLGFNLTY